MQVQVVRTEDGLVTFPIEDVRIMSTRSGLTLGPVYDGAPSHILWWDENGKDFQPIPLTEALSIFDTECEETSGFPEMEFPRLISWIRNNKTTEDIVSFMRANMLGRYIVMMNIIDRCPKQEMNIILGKDSHGED